MSNPLQRRALVTGGSGDLGGAICRALAAQGAHVIVHANGNLARAEAVRDDILSAGGSAEAVAFDVADGAATRAAIATLLEAGPIQIVVNNAGIHDDAPMAGLREEMDRCDVPRHLRGAGITLVTAGILSLAFLGFTGMDSGLSKAFHRLTAKEPTLESLPPMAPVKVVIDPNETSH